jgi:hypothetical protein
MNSIPVFATARSRLHADVMMIRLRKADIALEKISALSPSTSLPNSVACWLRGGRLFSLKPKNDLLLAIGPMRKWLLKADHGDFSLSTALQQARFDSVASHHLEEHLKQGNTLLCVQAADEVEVAIAWHVFTHAEAEFVALPTLPLNFEPPACEMPILFPALDIAIPA